MLIFIYFIFFNAICFFIICGSVLGYYRPLLHRAMLKPDRISAPFFLRSRPSARLCPLPDHTTTLPPTKGSSAGGMRCHEFYAAIRAER